MARLRLVRAAGALALAGLLAACEPILLKTTAQDQVASYVATGGGTVAVPVFSLPAGSYSTDARLAITTTTPGAGVRYTLDGTTPSSTNGLTYTGPLALPSYAVVTAVGTKGGWADSSPISGTYASYSAGSVDQSFSPPFAVQSFNPVFVGTQSNGKVIVVGNPTNGPTGSIVLRYPATGGNTSDWPNSTFYSNSTTAIPNPKAAAVDSSDRIIVVGGAWGVVRFTAAGAIDSGYTVSGLPGTGSANAVLPLPDGSLVLAGDDGTDMVLAKLTPSGAADASFGTNGVVTGPAGSLVKVLRQSDGRLVVAGNTTTNRLYGARYSASGVPDATFVFNTSFGKAGSPNTRINDAALQSDDKLVVAGSASDSVSVANPTLLLVGRRNLDGTADPTFGTAGSGFATLVVPQAAFLSSQAGYQYDTATHILVQPGNKLLVVARTFLTSLSADLGTIIAYQRDLVRFGQSGSLDPSYGSQGLLLASDYPYRTNLDQWQAASLQADGRLLLAGLNGDGASGAMLKLYRYW